MAKSTKKMTPRQAAKQPFLPLLRELELTHQTFATLDARLLRAYELTQGQADVIFTLGGTQGMTLGELGERTLTTKGTLTGVIDRLEGKGLVRRQGASHDRRCTLAVLTAAGEAVFERVFPAHIATLKQRFDNLSRRQMEAAISALREVRAVL